MAFLEKQIFTTVIDSTPLVSIDLLIEDKHGQILLGYRNNRPAQGYWFVPGGRILKGESMDNAFKRLTLAELGTEFSRGQAEFLGPYEHFYEDFVFGEGISTHYVVLGYKIICDIDINTLPNAQHGKYKWFTKQEMLSSDTVHKHSKWYIE
ncbi:GDP-mannose mannosyl hydrolase [Alteromonas marina]|uniref:GDP-mannose mannosyl hydrolase n=1 Tax=Alteromonas sp. OM2203 TaxID=3398817 RepID=UPI003AF39399